MNQKYFIILFSLLVFFLIHVEKTHGCEKPAGRGSCDATGIGITNAVWLSNSAELLITTNVPNSHIDAIGHFSFGYNGNTGFEFFKDPKYVNNFDCDEPDDTYLRNNPYTSIWPYDPKVRPPIGTNVEIWVAIYWDCDDEGNCCHTNVNFSSTVTANNCG